MSEVTLTHQPCPKCGSSDALSVYDDGHTYCFSCDNHTQGDTPHTPPPKKAHKDLIQFADLELKELNKRGITKETCNKYGYYTTNYKGSPCHVANYCDNTGTVTAQKLRFPDKTFATLGKPQTFFGQHLFSSGKKLVITEGEIDCLTVSQVNGNKYPVVSIPNGCQSAKKVFKEQLEWLNGFEEIIVMFDTDEPGRKAVEEVCRILPYGKLKIALLPMKDPNECLQAGRPDAIIQAIWQAKTYRPDGIVNGSELWEILNTNDPTEFGYSLPWNIELQDMTLGIRKGELMLITAGTGVGKTTFVRQLAYHFGVTIGLKVGMMMLEENVKRTARGIMAVHAGKRLALNKNLVSQEEYQTIYKETLDKGNFVFYRHFGSLESDNLLSKMRYLAVAENCDFIILDHITIAISGLEIDNERKATDVLMTNLRSLAEETGVGLLIISHLKRVDGTPAEEGGAISLSHLRGSQALAQLSDTVIALERNQQDEEDKKNIVRIRLLKNRFTGETGVAGQLIYNKETDRLDQLSHKLEKETFPDTQEPKGDF